MLHVGRRAWQPCTCLSRSGFLGVVFMLHLFHWHYHGIDVGDCVGTNHLNLGSHVHFVKVPSYSLVMILDDIDAVQGM